MENNHIDTTFKEASKAADEPETFPGFDKVWNTIEEKLDQKQEKKRHIPRWISYGVAAGLVIASGIFYFNSDTGNEEMRQTIIVKENSSATSLAHIQKTDSIVKEKILQEGISVASGKIVYHDPKKRQIPLAAIPVNNMKVMEPFHTTIQPEVQRKLNDTVKRKNIEEVIALGIKKEKAAVIRSFDMASIKKSQGLNITTDTADTGYARMPLTVAAPIHEPEILAYNKKIKPDKPVIGNSGVANLIGEKPDMNSIKGSVAGVKINSMSGTAGSGPVDNSIGYQRSSKPGANSLIVIDGVISDLESFRKLDPSKIVFISVIKNPKTKIPYASKADNGIVVVETKDISKKEKRKLNRFLRKELPKK